MRNEFTAIIERDGPYARRFRSCWTTGGKNLSAPFRLTRSMLLARLAADRRSHGQGIGKALLRDAMRRTLQAADIAGIRAFAVHAKNERARNFYQTFDFIPSPIDPMHLFVLLKDVRRVISGE
jgi:GNAT superfamily N-acetyltransferase